MDMVKKIVQKTTFEELAESNPDLEYWLTRPPQERVEAVEFLRRQVHGSSARLQRVLRIVKLPRR
jgi:hypothetical protein